MDIALGGDCEAQWQASEVDLDKLMGIGQLKQKMQHLGWIDMEGLITQADRGISMFQGSRGEGMVPLNWLG